MSRQPVETRVEQRTDKSGGPGACWPWTGTISRAGKAGYGYGVIKVAGRMMMAHRVAWELANGPIPDGLFVCHRCDNPPCVNPAHLFLGTPADNMADKVRKGRQVRRDTCSYERRPRGERHVMATLNDALVRRIRKLRSGGLQYREVARVLGLNQSAVNHVLCGDSWKHVT